MAVRLVVSITAAPGKGGELAQAFRARCAEVMQEPGCEQFEVFQQHLLDPDKLALLELSDRSDGTGCARQIERHPPADAPRPARRFGARRLYLQPHRMKVSYFETGRYRTPESISGVWPMPSGVYDVEAGADVYRGMVERIMLVEQLGFDRVSLSEHHYSPRILTPSPPMAAAYLASRVRTIKIALLGPIVSHANPVRLAEELAMLDTMADGRLIVGLLRGTTNEALTYDLNPREFRERTDEGMEPILKAWTEPQPFGWQGRHLDTAPYRSGRVRCSSRIRRPSLWAPAGRRGIRRAQPHRSWRFLWPVRGDGQSHRRLPRSVRAVWVEPTPDQIIFRANIVLAETDAEAQRAMEAYPARAAFAMGTGVANVLLELDTRDIAGEARPASVNRALPINFVGGPDTIVEQIRRCRELTGAGIVDLGFNTPGSSDPKALLAALELFGRKVLPRVRDI